MSVLFSLLLVFSLEVCRCEPSGENAGSVISAVKTLVWGPGLEVDIVLPARFFYIQAVDGSGKK